MQTSRRSKAVFLFEHPNRSLRRAELRDFWRQLVAALAPGQAATCLVTTDAVLCDLNARFRGKRSATDVLSFPGGEALGEIAISLDRAVEQAEARGHSTEEELRILMLHGLLHLTGMDHETDGGEMAGAETRWRKKLNLPIGLIERTHA
jgi:probable rRNA maturation factor